MWQPQDRTGDSRAGRWRRWGAAVGLLLACVAHADESTDRYWDALLERGLVQVAENEALRRLEDPFRKPVEQVEWTIRLARAFVRHAQLVSGADRETLAARGTALLTELAAVEPPLPRQEAIAAHQALLAAELAELKRWEWEVGGPDERLQTAAAQALRAAVDRLREVRDKLTEEARAAARRTPVQLADGELTAGEVKRLLREVEFRLAATLVSLGEVTSTRPLDSALFREADQRLQEFSQGWLGDVRTWEGRLLRARVARLRGDNAQAASIVQAALQDQPAAWLADRLTAELVRSQLAAGQIDAALTTLLTHGRKRGRLSEELIDLQVEALLQARRVAIARQDAATADELWQRAEAWTQQLHGGWAARTRLRLQRDVEAARYGDDVAALLHAARAAYQAGESERACAQFEAAARQALARGQTVAADEFDYTRGSILLHAERFEDAARVLGELVQRSPDGLHTQDADLLRAYALGRLYSREATRTRREQFAEALQQHRQRYAGTPSAAEAAWMLAQLEEGRQQWTAALPLYLELAQDPRHGAAAQQRAAILYEQILDRLRTMGQPLDAWEDQAVEELAAFVRGFPASPAEWSAVQSEVCLRLARIVLAHREHPYSEADKLLTAVQQAGEARHREAVRLDTTPAEEWSRMLHLAAQLRVVSLAGQGRIDEARQLFDSLAVAEPLTLLGLLQGLARLAEQIPEQRRIPLAHLQLETARQLRDQRTELTDEQRRVLDECLADASLAAGNIVDAIAMYESLLRSAPGDLARTRRIAGLLEREGTPESLARARSYWRQLERAERPGTEGWFEVRLRLAEIALRCGDVDEARKLIALTRLAYPELGGPELKVRFEQLEGRLTRAPE